MKKALRIAILTIFSISVNSYGRSSGDAQLNVLIDDLSFKNNESKIRIKERIESLFLLEVDSIYHLEQDKYLFTQRNISGNGNHYYDEIILRIISFSESEITLYPIDIEIGVNNGLLDENGCLIISQHQLFDFKDRMVVHYNETTKILSYQFHSIDVSSWETAIFNTVQYKFVDGTFKLISEDHKEVELSD